MSAVIQVPTASRHSSYNPASVLVILKGGPELDLSRMATDNTGKSAESNLIVDDDRSGISIMEISDTI